ncbi:MAG: hypothetical protein PHY29_11800 [Syntrophales bacterium]|nr:hypothetical protein [Syntrophales bacterium]
MDPLRIVLQNKGTHQIPKAWQLSGKLPQNIQNVAGKKLVILDAVPELNHLRISPGIEFEFRGISKFTRNSRPLGLSAIVLFACGIYQLWLGIHYYVHGQYNGPLLQNLQNSDSKTGKLL